MDIEQLRQAGFSDQEISAQLIPKLKAAGFSDGEIGAHLGGVAPEEGKGLFRRGAEYAGRQLVGAGEATLALGTGAALYLPSKAYGLMALPFGEETARIAEEGMAGLAYQPRTEVGRQAVEPVAKVFEYGLYPAKKVGELVTRALGPEAGYVAEFGAELATFKGVHGAGRGVKARIQRPGIPARPTVAELGEIPRAVEGAPVLAERVLERPLGVEIDLLKRRTPAELRQREITRVMAEEGLREAEAVEAYRGTPEFRQEEISRLMPEEAPGLQLGAEAGVGRPARLERPLGARALTDAELPGAYPLELRGERGLVRVGEPEYIPEAEIVPRGLLPPPEGKGPGFEYREPVIRRREPAYRAVEEPAEYPPVYEKKGKAIVKRPEKAKKPSVTLKDMAEAQKQAAIAKEAAKPTKAETFGKRVEDEVKQHVDAAILAEKKGKALVVKQEVNKARKNGEKLKTANGAEVEKLVDEQLGRLPVKPPVPAKPKVETKAERAERVRDETWKEQIVGKAQAERIKDLSDKEIERVFKNTVLSTKLIPRAKELRDKGLLTLEDVGIKKPPAPKPEKVEPSKIAEAKQPVIDLKQLETIPALADYVTKRPEIHAEDVVKKAEGIREKQGQTLDMLGMQTAYEKIAGAVRKLKEEKPLTREASNKLKRDVHITAKKVWGKEFSKEYEAFKERMFGRKVSARDLTDRELRQLDKGIGKLRAMTGAHVEGSKARIVKHRTVRTGPREKLTAKDMKVGQEYASYTGLFWKVISKDKEGVVVQNAKGTKKKIAIDKSVRLAKKLKADLKAPALSEYESNVVRSLPELRGRPLGGWTENPIRVFEELGPQIKELTHEKMRGAEVTAKKELIVLRKEMKSVTKGLGLGSQTRIGTYAVAQQKYGKATLKAMGIKKIPTLNKREIKAYNWMRGQFESFYNRVNEAREASGLAPFGKVENYFTFMRVFSQETGKGWNAYMPTAVTQFGKAYNKFIQKHFKATPFRFAKERRAARRELRLDAFNVFDLYADTALHHIHKSPLIARGREYLLKFDDGFQLKDMKPNTAAFLTQWLDAAAGQRVKQLPAVIEAGLNKLNTNLTFAVLSANIRSALIQPTAWLNTVTEIGPRYASEGVSGIFRPMIRKQIMAKSALITRQYDIAVREAMTGLTGRIGKVKKIVGTAALKPLGILDMETAMASWWGAYQKAIKFDKLSEQRARVYADDVVTKTQASALEIDLAPIQRTAIGRTLSLFQTFVINNWNFLMRDVAGIKNPRISKAQAIKKAATWVAGATLVNMLYEDAMQIPSPLPTPIRAFVDEYEKGKSLPEASLKVAREMSELVPIIGGGIRYGSHPFGAIAQLGADVVEKISDRPGPKKSYIDISGRMVGVPGTAQYGKTARRLKWGYSLPEAALGVGKGKKKGASRTRGLDTRSRRRKARR